MQSNEKNSVMQMLERESKREKNLEARAKELRAKEKRAAESQANEGAGEKTPWEESVKAIEGVTLHDGDMLLLTGKARWEYLHRVAPRAGGGEQVARARHLVGL